MRTVTKKGIEDKITGADYHKLGETLTVCVITVENGFAVTGESACADPENYNAEIGQRLAYEDAFDKLWALEGYLLKEQMFREFQEGQK